MLELIAPGEKLLHQRVPQPHDCCQWGLKVNNRAIASRTCTTRVCGSAWAGIHFVEVCKYRTEYDTKPRTKTPGFTEPGPLQQTSVWAHSYSSGWSARMNVETSLPVKWFWHWNIRQAENWVFDLIHHEGSLGHIKIVAQRMCFRCRSTSWIKGGVLALRW